VRGQAGQYRLSYRRAYGATATYVSKIKTQDLCAYQDHGKHQISSANRSCSSTSGDSVLRQTLKTAGEDMSLSKNLQHPIAGLVLKIPAEKGKILFTWKEEKMPGKTVFKIT
jgi:hypothetical protein